MKKRFTLIELVVVICIIAIFTGICLPVIVQIKRKMNGDKTVVIERKIDPNKINGSDGHEYTILKIDGCEYITSGSYYLNNFAIAHKGNCSNPIHSKTIQLEASK